MRLNETNIIEAAQGWGFNCGPAAVCAIMDMAPDEIRPHLCEFESKGYTNPSMMRTILQSLGVEQKTVFRSDDPLKPLPEIKNGLIRIQWGGSWTKPGVPMMARYRRTHWVAARMSDNVVLGVDHNGVSYKDKLQIFDVNALGAGGWFPVTAWCNLVAPWVIQQCVAKGDGTFWPTHGIEVAPKI